MGDARAVAEDLGPGALVVRLAGWPDCRTGRGRPTRDARAASRWAIRTAPLDPSDPGDSMISAPHSSSSWRRSIETLVGITTLRW